MGRFWSERDREKEKPARSEEDADLTEGFGIAFECRTLCFKSVNAVGGGGRRFGVVGERSSEVEKFLRNIPSVRNESSSLKIGFVSKITLTLELISFVSPHKDGILPRIAFFHMVKHTEIRHRLPFTSRRGQRR